MSELTHLHDRVTPYKVPMYICRIRHKHDTSMAEAQFSESSRGPAAVHGADDARLTCEQGQGCCDDLGASVRLLLLIRAIVTH